MKILSFSFFPRMLSALGVMVFLACAALLSPAEAASLESAKAQGLVGERIDGLLGSVKSPTPADIAALISEINEERLKRYKSIAASNGTSLQAVQAIVGRKLIEKTADGQFIDDGSGWRKK